MKKEFQKNIIISYLVALTFIPNFDDYPVIDHINRIRHDNRVDNLRRVTYSENAKNSEKRGQKNGIKIIQYDLDGTQIKVWCNFISIKNELGLIHKRVVKACKNRTILNESYWSASLFDDISIENE